MKHSHVRSGKRQWFAHLAASEGARAGGARGASRGAMSSLSAHALREVWDWHKPCLHLPMVPWAAVPPDPQRLRPRQCQRHRHCEAVSPCSRGDPSTTPRNDQNADIYPGSDTQCDEINTTICSSGGIVEGSNVRGVFCFAPMDVAAAPKASNSSITWEPGPMTQITKPSN